MASVRKPALLRRLFYVACKLSGQILSYQKTVGQLQESGNVQTVSHYLDLLSGAGMVAGIQKYAGPLGSHRASSPKYQVYNTALISSQDILSLDETKKDARKWGRLVESAVGSHILNSVRGSSVKSFYWRERDLEVDFVLQRGEDLLAIEVKSGVRSSRLPGMRAFADTYPVKRNLLIGSDGIPLEYFLSRSLDSWF